MTDDGAFRVIAAITTETVRGAVEAQEATGAIARCLGELLTGTILVRETMAPPLRVQGIAKGAGGRGTLVADSHPNGAARGLVQLGGSSRPDAFSLGAGSLLQLMRTLPNGAIHQGIVDVSDAGGISAALTQYMQDSEQVVSVVAVSTLLADGGAASASGTVTRAGGYVVQLLPGAERGVLMIMTERLRALPTLGEMLQAGDVTPRSLLSELLHGMPFTELDDSRVRFECSCSLVNVVASLSTLDAAAIEDLVRPEKVLEIQCDYCKKQYGVSPAQLRGLLRQS
jgi:molecular chaperone Hsp33